MLSAVFELTALNFTLPAVFASASADKDTVTAGALTWIEPDAIVTGISSASAFPALLSVASATISGGLEIAAPE